MDLGLKELSEIYQELITFATEETLRQKRETPLDQEKRRHILYLVPQDPF